MFAGAYTAEAPIGRFQMLSRENGQRSGSRPPGGPPPGGGFVVTERERDVVGPGDPLLPVTVREYGPAVVPVGVHVEVWVPRIVEGEQPPVPPAGDELVVSATPPVKPPVDCRLIVDVAD